MSDRDHAAEDLGSGSEWGWGWTCEEHGSAFTEGRRHNEWRVSESIDVYERDKTQGSLSRFAICQSSSTVVGVHLINMR